MRCSKLVMCALSSTQALDEALVRSVQCSKQARKALARGDVPVAWLDVTAADDAVAERLAPLLAGPARCAHDDDAFEAHNARTKREFVELFAGDGLDPANNELAPATAVAVARGLNLNAADAFCDLGCSAGALTMAVAVATDARLAHGVELSPRGTERALLAKERTGDGQHVKLSMLDAMVSLAWPEGYAGHTFVGSEADVPRNALAQDLVFETKDGFMTAGAVSDSEWQGLTRALGHPEWLDDDRFKTAGGRVAYAKERLDQTADVLVTRTTEEWLERLDAEQVPCAPILPLSKILEHPQIEATGVVVETDHPVAGRIRQARAAARFDKTPTTLDRPAPTLGEHTDEILAELGLAR